MGDDNYGAALLAMGIREHSAAQYTHTTYGVSIKEGQRATWFQDYTAPPDLSKRAKAIAYLRERKLYCLDSPVGRIPPQARPMTLLDKWMKERHK